MSVVSENERHRALLLFLVFLVSIDLFLVALNFGSILALGSANELIYLGYEQNIPTWWSSVKFLLAGMCFLAVSFRTWFAQPATRGLAVLGLLLVAMSADEMVSIHERIGIFVDGEAREGGLFPQTGIWFLVLGVPAILVIGLVLWYLWTSLSAVSGTGYRLLLGFATFLFAALGLEATSNFALRHVYAVIVEEGVELVGVSVLLWAGVVFFMNHPSLSGVSVMIEPERAMS